MNAPAAAADVELLETYRQREDPPRKAFRLLADLIQHLPTTDYLLFSAEAVAAWQTLHDTDPENFMVYRATVRGKLGPFVARLLDERIDGRRPSDSTWPESLDLEALAEREPEQPRFIIEDWLPCGYATLFAGHGGVGKSAIALHLAICMAAGEPFFGLPVLQRRRVLYLSCEDRASVLHWRLTRICSYTGVDLASLRGWLEVVDLVGQPSILWEREQQTGLTLTAVYALLAQRMQRQPTQVLIVDGISDVYGGSENSRGEVKRFVNAMLALIPPEDGALLLIGHIPKPVASGVATSEGYSGSTQWHNAARARWYLYPETDDGDNQDQPQRTGDLILQLQKSNLGRYDQSMRFSWDESANLFVGSELAGATAFDRQHRDRTEQTAIMRALKACAEQKPPVIVPAAMQGPRTAANTLRERPEWPATLKIGKASAARFRRLLEVIRQSGLVEEQGYMRPDRHKAMRLVLTEKGLRECGQ